MTVLLYLWLILNAFAVFNYKYSKTVIAIALVSINDTFQKQTNKKKISLTKLSNSNVRTNEHEPILINAVSVHHKFTMPNVLTKVNTNNLHVKWYHQTWLLVNEFIVMWDHNEAV